MVGCVTVTERAHDMQQRPILTAAMGDPVGVGPEITRRLPRETELAPDKALKTIV